MASSKNDKTIILIIGFIVVTIAGFFYAPWEGNAIEMMNIPADKEKIFPIALFLLKIFLPLINTCYESMFFILNYAKENDSVWMTIVFASIAILTYAGTSVLIEKYHDAIEGEYTSRFKIFIEILCLENMVMYIANLIVYFIIKILGNVNGDNIIIVIMAVLLGIVTMWLGICFVFYLQVWVIVSMGPASLIMQLPLNEKILQGLAVLCVLFIQVLWRDKLSKFFFNLMSKFFMWGLKNLWGLKLILRFIMKCFLLL